MTTSTPNPRNVRVMFDSTAERWEIAFEEASGTGELEGSGAVMIGRDWSGMPVEVIIDMAELTSVELATIRAVFGPEVADLVVSMDPVDVDMVVTVSSIPVESTGGGLLDTSTGRTYVIPRPGARDLDVRVERGTLRVRIPGTDDVGRWVTVSTAVSGAPLAMAPLRHDATSQSAVADIEFGLPIPIEDLHFAVRREPLGASHRSGHSAPRTARRPRRWWSSSVGIALVAVIGGVAVWWSTDDPASRPPGDPGPATYVSSSGSSVTASVIGAPPDVKSGDVLTMTFVLSSRALGGYGPPPGTVVDEDDEPAVESDARANCLNVTNFRLPSGANLPASEVQIVMTRVASDSSPVTPAERINLGPIRIDAPFIVQTTVKESCRSASLANGMFLAETDFIRDSVEIDVPMPAELASGRWRLDIVLDLEATNTITPVIIRVLD